MTIESLRARLLSERAMSKTSRQRADELAKRVSLHMLQNLPPLSHSHTCTLLPLFLIILNFGFLSKYHECIGSRTGRAVKASVFAKEES